MFCLRFSNDSINSKKCGKSKDRQRSCTEKTKHKTQTEAAKAAIAYHRRVVIRNSDVVAYECRHCVYWHIGHDYGGQNREKRVKMREVELAILLLLSPAPSRMAVSKRSKILRTSTQRGLGIAA